MLTFRVNKCFILSKLNGNKRCRVTVNIKFNTGTVILKNSEQWWDTELQLEAGPYPNPLDWSGFTSTILVASHTVKLF